MVFCRKARRQHMGIVGLHSPVKPQLSVAAGPLRRRTMKESQVRHSVGRARAVGPFQVNAPVARNK